MITLTIGISIETAVIKANHKLFTLRFSLFTKISLPRE